MNNSPQTKKICQLSSVHPYFDTRVFLKECRTLAAFGYSVTLIARKDDGIATTIDGVEVIPFREYSNRFKRILFSSWRMFRMALQQKAAIYHFHDPELLTVGILLKLAGKKVIYDVHEDYHSQLLQKSWLKSRWLKLFIAKSYRLFEIVSRSLFDRIITATEDIATLFPAHKTHVIRNLPILTIIDKAAPFVFTREKPIILYAGALAKIRGAYEIVQMMEFLKHDAELWLLGKWESQALQQQCMALPGWAKVKYLGLKKPDEVYSYMKIADVGLAIIHPVQNYLVGLPVKSFEYLACGAPMLMSGFPFWEKLFAGCAHFTDPLNPQQVAQQVDDLLDHPEERLRLSEAGLHLVQTKYSWEAESQRLLQLYQQL